MTCQTSVRVIDSGRTYEIYRERDGKRIGLTFVGRCWRASAGDWDVWEIAGCLEDSSSIVQKIRRWLREVS